jgi:putative addiction module component (TIGR02574 family)
MSANTVEKEALALPEPERAKLAELLLASLESLPEKDVEALWLNVAERRAAEIDQGQVEMVTPEELDRRIQARLK